MKERLSQRYQVDVLILFGSRARGEGDESSDYDFITVSRDFCCVPFLECRRGMAGLREPGFACDFLCYAPEECQAKVQQIGIVREAVKMGASLI